METLQQQKVFHQQVEFQKDLIVWKLVLFSPPSEITIEFQKDLIVWKLFAPGEDTMAHDDFGFRRT